MSEPAIAPPPVKPTRGRLFAILAISHPFRSLVVGLVLGEHGCRGIMHFEHGVSGKRHGIYQGDAELGTRTVRMAITATPCPTITACGTGRISAPPAAGRAAGLLLRRLHDLLLEPLSG